MVEYSKNIAAEFYKKINKCFSCNAESKEISYDIREKIMKTFYELSYKRDRIRKKKGIIKYLNFLHSQGYDIRKYAEILVNND